MNFLRRRPASFQLLAERDFRNYFVADAMFDFAAQLRLIAMGWAALTLTNSQFWVGLMIGIPGLKMQHAGHTAHLCPVSGNEDRCDLDGGSNWAKFTDFMPARHTCHVLEIDQNSIIYNLS